jgi:RNA polymerase sigma factor (sigma-70 family)
MSELYELPAPKPNGTLAEQNVALIPHIINRYYMHVLKHYPDMLHDAFAEGYIALMHAEKHFNPAFGFAFTTYACSCIKRKIGNLMHRNNTYRERFRQAPLLAFGTEAQYNKPMDVLDVMEERPDNTPEDYSDFWNRVRNSLSNAEAFVLRKRCQGMTLEEIGRIMKVTRARAGQISKKVSKFLMEEFGEEFSENF